MDPRRTRLVPGYEGGLFRVLAGSKVRVIDVGGFRIGDLFVRWGTR